MSDGEHPNSGLEPDQAKGLGGISPWCYSAGKRIFDLIGAGLALIPGLPVMAIVALVVKLSSRGPVLFRQVRMGKDARQFRLLKFRTMVHDRCGSGPGLTRSGDRRVTGAGRVLRWSKLDELPQLFNVIRGEMSLVGPRPDLPQYMAELHPARREVFTLRPGITSAASLCFRNEERLLSTVSEDDLMSYYIRTVLPRKIDIDLAYARRATWFSDLCLVLRTVAVVNPFSGNN